MAIDPAIEKVSAAVHKYIQPQDLRDVLHGVPIGHPVHPLAVLVPAGSWVATGVLDLIPGTAKSARVLTGFGVLAAIPTAITGYTDWSELHKQQQRVGLVHSGANLVAIGLYTASWLQRRRGHHSSGKVLGYLGLAIVSGSGYLGGHLSYRMAAGANHSEDVPHRFPHGWQHLASLDELPEGQLTRRDVAGQPLLVLRRGSSVDVISNRCSHLGGPLDEGSLIAGHSDDPCVACPWHGSVFSISNGEVMHGPATAPQPRFEARVTGTSVEVLLPHAG
ncbi:MAG: (2Fe-2S)-binding protein [Microbacteriaceae bacterium]|nr:(2Fe-2S)-binding protein [Microbacteriaceae bacterium]